MPEKPPSFEAATGQGLDPRLPAWSTLRKSQEVPTVDETKALDLGEIFRLKPHRVRPPDPPPTFMAYNLVLNYFLEYKIDLRTVDVDHRAEGLVPVALLGPSGETEAEMRPYRAHESARHDDFKEWARMTGAGIHFRDAPKLLGRRFGDMIDNGQEKKGVEDIAVQFRGEERCPVFSPINLGPFKPRRRQTLVPSCI